MNRNDARRLVNDARPKVTFSVVLYPTSKTDETYPAELAILRDIVDVHIAQEAKAGKGHCDIKFIGNNESKLADLYDSLIRDDFSVGLCSGIEAAAMTIGW